MSDRDQMSARGYAPLGPSGDKEGSHLYPGTYDRLANGAHHDIEDQPLAHDLDGDAPMRRRTAYYNMATDRAQVFVDRLRGKGRRKVGWLESFKNIALSSCE